MTTRSPRLSRFIGPFAVASVLLGLCLAVASWLLPENYGAESSWTDEQSAAYAEAALDFHRLSHEDVHRQQQGSRSIPFHKGLADAKAQYQTLRKQLDVARTRPQYIASGMRITGMVLLVVGGIILLVQRQGESA